MFNSVSSFRRYFLRHRKSGARWCSGNGAHVCAPEGLRVQIIETSLGVGVDNKLLRHLALRFGSNTDELHVPDGDFTEAHFGPGSGSFKTGFLNVGEGMVADSEYLEISEAGYTDRSIEECLDWCRNWAEGRLYVTVGQNCWSMVSQFLEEDEKLQVPESVKFKEDQINGWTELFVTAAQEKADKDGVEIGEVWDGVMKDPRTFIPELVKAFPPEKLKEYLPENVTKVAENYTQVKEAVVAKLAGDGEHDGVVTQAGESVKKGLNATLENLSDFADAKAQQMKEVSRRA